MGFPVVTERVHHSRRRRRLHEFVDATERPVWYITEP
jgi:hypothetical protein